MIDCLRGFYNFLPMCNDYPQSGDPLHESVFLRACRREKTEYTPIWLMRQAGRFLPEYRRMREKYSFLQMCKTPELATEVTLMPIHQLGVDAAILFADILLVTEPLGMKLVFEEGKGPILSPAIENEKQVEQLNKVQVAESLDYVFDAVRMVRQALPSDIPLIGFCGAPFTVASYMIEGQSSRNFVRTKTLMYNRPKLWHSLMDKIVCASADYLNGQIDAGVQAVQLFDSWAGCLCEADYRQYVLPYTQRLIRSLKPTNPVIHFAANNAMLLDPMREAGGEVIGVDWRINLGEAWAQIGYDKAIQGNLDPAALFAERGQLIRRTEVILEQAENRPGHVFNLGHGVLPDTPVENVQALVEIVHEYRGD